MWKDSYKKMQKEISEKIFPRWLNYAEPKQERTI